MWVVRQVQFINVLYVQRPRVAILLTKLLKASHMFLGMSGHCFICDMISYSGVCRDDRVV